MILTLSIGNFTMAVGFYTSLEEKQIYHVSIHRRMTSDDFYLRLSQLADLSGGQSLLRGAVVASVVPSLTLAAAEAVQRLCGVRPYIVGPGLKTGIDIKINDPSQLGADLVAMAAGVQARYPLPALLISISEATTIGYLDAGGRYLGTVICAGVGPSLQSLVEGAELLNPVPLSAPERALGACTEESIRSGLVYGTAGMIDALCARLGQEHSVKTVVATGGPTALAILPHCTTQAIYDESLLSDGMYHIFSRQRPPRGGRA